jgi:8-oxo-dGTP diphosphatase
MQTSQKDASMHMHIKGSHCSYCGSLFLEQVTWPRQCFICGHDSYANPTPVVIMLLDVREENVKAGEHGILIQKRNIEPGKDQWALPSGYQNLGETWQEACAREVKEEMNLITNPNQYRVYDVCMNSTNTSLLLFTCYLGFIPWGDVHFSPNDEVSAIDLATEPQELAFASHTQYLAQYIRNSTTW